MQLERLLARQMEILQDAAVQERLQALDWRIPPAALKYLTSTQKVNGAASDSSKENQGKHFLSWVHIKTLFVLRTKSACSEFVSSLG